MDFTKYHIAGKDYIYCADKTALDNLTKTDIITLCDRHKGVGADGIFAFCQNTSKISLLQGFFKNGKSTLNFSSASICAVFELFLTTGLTEYTFLSENGQQITVKTDISEGTPVFTGTLEAYTSEGIFGKTNRKTEIGNRILTITPVWLHGIYAVHFSDCRENLNINYLGQHISKNSLFRKEGNLILAESVGKNFFNISFYENNTGCPRPDISAFGATALAACRNGISDYGEYISVTCNDNTITVICHSPDTVTIKCTCDKIFEGHYKI